MIRVTIRCEYQGTGIAPTSVTFQAAPELGDTPEAVHDAIQRLLERGEPFLLPAVGDPPYPFAPETVREVRVR